MRRVPAGLGLFPDPPGPGRPGDPGLFGPGSEAWRVARERVLLAAGPAALLLQLAHPLVAAGVAEHSDFQADPLHRLRATLDATCTVVFGDRAQAVAAAARVAGRHRSVAGRTASAAGPFAAGTAYRAGDPHLALWVHATLLWSALEAHDGFVAPLPVQRRDAYVAEMRAFGRLFGVPEELAPATWGELADLVRSADEDGVLQTGPQARALASDVLTGAGEQWPAPLGPAAGVAAEVLAAGLLPPRLRDGYGLAWGRREQRTFAALRRATRVVLPAVPAPLRYWPHHRVAVRRLRAAGVAAGGSGLLSGS